MAACENGVLYSMRDLVTRPPTDEEIRAADPALRRRYELGVLNDREFARLHRGKGKRSVWARLAGRLLGV